MPEPERTDTVEVRPWKPDANFTGAILTADAVREVTNPVEYELAARLVRDLKRYKRDCEAHYKPITSAFDSMKRRVMDMKKNDIITIDRYLVRLEAQAVAWKTAQERAEQELTRKAEETARQQALADRRAKLDALEAAAQLVPSLKTALKLEAEALIAQTLVPAATAVPTTIPKVQGFSTVKRRRVKRVDLRALLQAIGEGVVPLDVLMVNNARLNDYVEQMGEGFNFPGVELEEVTSTVGR